MFYFGKYTLMGKDDKKRFKKNLMQLIFGLLLLILSFSYLRNHQAEAKSIRSGFDTLFEKMAVSRERLVNREDADLLEKKFKLEKYLKDIAGTVDEKHCLKDDELEKVKTLLQELDSVKTAELKDNLDTYFQKIYAIDALVKQSCK